MRPATIHLRAIRSLRCLMPSMALGSWYVLFCLLTSCHYCSWSWQQAIYQSSSWGKAMLSYCVTCTRALHQDPSVCRPLHTESLCFQVSSDKFSWVNSIQDLRLFKPHLYCSFCSV